MVFAALSALVLCQPVASLDSAEPLGAIGTFLPRAALTGAFSTRFDARSRADLSLTLGADWFAWEDMSVGGSAGISAMLAGPVGSWSITSQLRLGVLVHLTRRLAWWPIATFAVQFNAQQNDTPGVTLRYSPLGVQPGFEGAFVMRLSEHAVLGVGPWVVVSNAPGEPASPWRVSMGLLSFVGVAL